MSDVEERLQNNEADLLEIERRKVDVGVSRAETALKALDVRAPHAGIATLTRDRRGEPIQVGTEVWRGQSIAEIPDLSATEAELFVLEADASALSAGRPARVSLESHRDVEIGGTIKSVETVAKPRSRGSPVQYVGVVVELEEVEPEIRALMKLGQRITAQLDLDQRTDVLQIPRQAIFVVDGATWVRVQGRNGEERRRIEIETQSLSRVVIASGLEEGEVVLLESPDLDAQEEVEAEGQSLRASSLTPGARG